MAVYFDFEETLKKAEEQKKIREEEERKAWAELSARHQKRVDEFNDSMAKLSAKARENWEKQMLADIEEAKQKAEAEVRERYRKEHGRKGWNKTKEDEVWLEFSRNVAKQFED